MSRHPLAWRPFGADARRDRPVNHRPRPLFRFDVEEDSVAPETEGGRDARLALVEAALFAADEPLSPRRLAAVVGLTDVAELRRQVRRLQTLYEADGSGFQVEELAGGYQLLTRPEFHPWLVRLRRGVPELKLTPALLETLSIVAYKQPVPRADVEAVRGVQCAEALRQLLEKGLVRIAGRDDSLGRPQLYATTRKFLQAFGLNSLRDLPQAAELRAPAVRKAPEAKEDDQEG
jgi:segregation and condensation protein B